MIQKKDQKLGEGMNRLKWDATDGNGIKVKPGIYLIQLQSEFRREIFKVVYQGE